jgi:tetratricopeptide (TPR) repeat protein
MRISSFSITILFLISSLLTASATVDVSDLGVPAGWSAFDYDNHGNDLLNKGDYVNARKYLSAAIRVEPDRWSAYYNRALTFWKQKNWVAALPDLNSTIRLQPAFFEASWVRSGVYLRLGNYNASLKDLNALAKVTVKVENAEEYCTVLNRRAWLRATCLDGSVRNGQLALSDAKKMCELTKWKEASYIDTLAAACAEAGDFESAIRHEQQAISVNKSAPAETRRNLSEQVRKEIENTARQSAEGFSKRLELYKQDRPYREDTR